MADVKYDVLGIGNALFDVLVKTDEAFLGKHGMTKGSMSLIDEARAAPPHKRHGRAERSLGGAAPSTGTWARRRKFPAVRLPTPSSASAVSGRAPPMLARSRTTRSGSST